MTVNEGVRAGLLPSLEEALENRKILGKNVSYIRTLRSRLRNRDNGQVTQEMWHSPRSCVKIWRIDQPRRKIPYQINGIEGAVRRIIGGGGLSSWEKDFNYIRGGGSVNDAVRLMNAQPLPAPRQKLSDIFPDMADLHRLLGVSKCIRFEIGENMFKPTHLNMDARSGPGLEAFGLRRKGDYGYELADLAREIFEYYSTTDEADWKKPQLFANVGCRTKLRDYEKAKKKIENEEPFARAVSMVDAIEQFLITPASRPAGKYFKERSRDMKCVFKQKLQRTSSSWASLGRKLHEWPYVHESDHPTFDLNQDEDDISFAIDVYLSLFRCVSTQELVMLRVMKFLLRAFYLTGDFIDDVGNWITYFPLIKSGTSLTSDLDSILRALKNISTYFSMGYTRDEFMTFVCGDDSIDGVEYSSENFTEMFVKFTNDVHGVNMTADDSKIFKKSQFLVQQRQPIYASDQDLNSTSKKGMVIVGDREVIGELVVDHAQGLTHRNYFTFRDCPTFLKFGWMSDYLPGRGANEVCLRQLHPEGTCRTLRDYVVMNLGNLIDNPFNTNAVNHCMQKILVATQATLISYHNYSTTRLLGLMATERAERGSLMLFPEVGFMNRSDRFLEPEPGSYMEMLKNNIDEFVARARSLYLRGYDSGVEAWRLKEILQLRPRAQRGMWGSEFTKIMEYMLECPLGKALGLKVEHLSRKAECQVSTENKARLRSYASHYMTHLKNGGMENGDYAQEISKMLYDNHMRSRQPPNQAR